MRLEYEVLVNDYDFALFGVTLYLIEVQRLSPIDLFLGVYLFFFCGNGVLGERFYVGTWELDWEVVRTLLFSPPVSGFLFGQ